MFVKPLTRHFKCLSRHYNAVLFNVILASDISVFPDITAEETLQQSRHVLQTNGEWELTNITIAHSTLVLDVGSYSEIKYFVRFFKQN